MTDELKQTTNTLKLRISAKCDYGKSPKNDRGTPYRESESRLGDEHEEY